MSTTTEEEQLKTALAQVTQERDALKATLTRRARDVGADRAARSRKSALAIADRRRAEGRQRNITSLAARCEVERRQASVSKTLLITAALCALAACSSTSPRRTASRRRVALDRDQYTLRRVGILPVNGEGMRAEEERVPRRVGDGARRVGRPRSSCAKKMLPRRRDKTVPHGTHRSGRDRAVGEALQPRRRGRRDDHRAARLSAATLGDRSRVDRVRHRPADLGRVAAHGCRRSAHARPCTPGSSRSAARSCPPKVDLCSCPRNASPSSPPHVAMAW